MGNGKQALAKLLYALPYGELMTIGQELAAMSADDDVRKKPATAFDYASLLYDWAVATASDSK